MMNGCRRPRVLPIGEVSRDASFHFEKNWFETSAAMRAILTFVFLHAIRESR
jgi:hypothetical protein